MSLFDTITHDVAPALSTALGGPLAGAAVTFLADKLGASDKTQETVAQLVQGVDPLKLKQMDEDFQLKMASLGIQLQLAQIEVNKTEAQSTNWFVAGWRPYVGWVCGTGLGYQFLFMPIVNGIIVACGYKPPFAGLDVSTLLTCLSGLLGFGTLRTFEKHQEVESNR